MKTYKLITELSELHGARGEYPDDDNVLENLDLPETNHIKANDDLSESLRNKIEGVKNEYLGSDYFLEEPDYDELDEDEEPYNSGTAYVTIKTSEALTDDELNELNKYYQEIECYWGCIFEDEEFNEID